MSGNDQLTQGQLLEVKKILNDLVKEQLIEKNEFDVQEIHKLLSTFNMHELEKELALCTKKTFLDVTLLLGRTLLNTDVNLVGLAKSQENTERNNEQQATTNVFYSLMSDDREAQNLYGTSTKKMDSLNATEALNAMCFGWVNGLDAGSTVNAATVRGAATGTDGADWSAVRDISIVTGNTTTMFQLPLRGHEARAVYLIGLWTKHSDADNAPVILFGTGAHKIRVSQSVDDAANANNFCFCNTYCEVAAPDRIKEYYLWDQSAEGKNHFVSMLGALVAHEMVESDQISRSKLVGGEEALNINKIKALSSNDGGFTSDQLKQIFAEGTETTRTSSVQQLNNVKGLGFNKVDEDLGITFKSSAQDTILEIADGSTQSEANTAVNTALTTGGAFANAGGSRIQISTTTPGLREILKSDFGDDFLEKVAWDSGSQSVDLRSLATLINLGFVAENSVAIVQDPTTDTRNWMALKEALKLVQRIERKKEVTVTQSWLELLEKHDNSPSASAYKKISSTVHTFIISATLAGHLTSEEASGRNINDKDLSVFNYIAYESRHHEFNLDEDSNVVNSIDKLYPNDYYRKSLKSSIKSVAQKVILLNFRAAPEKFINNLGEHISIFEEGTGGYTGENKQTHANLVSAFGSAPNTWSSDDFGNIFDLQCSGLSAQGEYSEQKARVYVYLFTMLDNDHVNELLKKQAVYNQNSVQASALLKYNPRKDGSNSTLSFINATEAIRNAITTNVLGKAPYETGAITVETWIMESGKFSDKRHFGANMNRDVEREAVRDYAVRQIASALFNNDEDETCRLQLVNDVPISATKIQNLANKISPNNLVKDFENNDKININDFDELYNAMTTGAQKDLINNKAYVNSVFMAVAQSTTHTSIDSENTTSTSRTYVSANTDGLLGGGATATQLGTVMIRSRDYDLIDNLRASLAGGSREQIFEFFYMMSKVCNPTTPTVYSVLAMGIINQISHQLAEDDKNSFHHLPSGWASHEHPKITEPKERRSVLTEAAKQYFNVTGAYRAVSVAGTISLLDGSDAKDVFGDVNTFIEQDDINNISSLSKTSQSKVVKVDQYIAKLAKRVAPLYTINELVNELGLIYADTYTPIGSFGKLFTMYVAAYQNEDRSLGYRLFDTEVSMAGVGQETIKVLIESGYIDLYDLQHTMHTVKLSSSIGQSLTSSEISYASHTIAAIDGDGDPVSCERLDLSGCAEWSEKLTVNYEITNPEV